MQTVPRRSGARDRGQQTDQIVLELCVLPVDEHDYLLDKDPVEDQTMSKENAAIGTNNQKEVDAFTDAFKSKCYLCVFSGAKSKLCGARVWQGFGLYDAELEELAVEVGL
ncbi:hypothetical protein Z517_01214 [Fonsecaea pedrosoi CBS 271.37]|uniref:Uncharacterized protein n=1 Tax=Fonsecaea pedrosoi CBS 271.37 TaxID=1442368 RepID=A0A0D2FGK6_9EURO|nr:uncharacterized protein Z517_01214 [Fonsecaea pedrosoi CBS 271.37]KIW85822.1 hypothetical protein Z517_01214 [Fonsecaea pedrosoi CBS 271.37]